MRKIFLAFLLVFCFVLPVSASDHINTLNIDGQSFKFIEPLIEQEGRVLAPIRPIFEILEVEFQWDQETRTINGLDGQRQITIGIDDKYPIINGTEYTLDVPAQIINNRAYVPLRFIGESLGYAVAWDQENKIIHLNKISDVQDEITISSFEPRTEDNIYADLKVVSSAIGQGTSYGGEFHGRKTANGEIYDQYAFTAAHPTLPFDTYVRVTCLDTEKSIVLRINDRGPNQKRFPKRIIDISRAAAEAIGHTGIKMVKVEVLE